jgi:alpha-ketoglutarate-dependent taurine dioxygenase
MRVFFSYANEDEKMRDELAKHMKSLEKNNLITSWHKGEITAGEERRNEIDNNLRSAKIILLLISADFLDSLDCHDIEFKRAKERHGRRESLVIPVILREVCWEIYPFLKDLQPLPTEGKPIKSWADQDAAYKNVVVGIRRAIESLLVTDTQIMPNDLSTVRSGVLAANQAVQVIDLGKYKIREYRPTVAYLIKYSIKSFDMILRSGKILEECFQEINLALKKGCHIRVVALDDKNVSLIRSMSYESQDSLGRLQANFAEGKNAIKLLMDLSNSPLCAGKFEIEICKHYLPSELVFISILDESQGLLFATPLKYKQDPRSSPSILTTAKEEPEIFQSYQNEFNSLWEYLKSDKDFDSNFDYHQSLLPVQSISQLSEPEIIDMYKIFQKWGFVIIRPNATDEYMNSCTHELLNLKQYFGKDFEHERSDKNGISKITLEPGYPDHFSTNNFDTGLHTDGSYVENPPKVVIHQCIVPSETGGKTLLVSFKNVYRQIPDDASIRLLTCPSLTFTLSRSCRSHTRSVFCNCERDGRIHAAFRSNRHSETVHIGFSNGFYKQAFNKLDEIIHDPKNILTFNLKKFDILVLDNTSVLHGRNEFEDGSDRLLHRLLLDGKLDGEIKERYGGKLHLGFEP